MRTVWISSCRPAVCRGVVIALVAAVAVGATALRTAASQPVAGEWRRTGDLQQARLGHCATALRDGRVLVAGGQSAAVGGPVSTASSARNLDSAELYDPRAETWSAATPMPVSLGRCQAYALPDGRALVIGQTFWYGQIFDPVANTWALVADPPDPTAFFARFVLLPGGRLLRLAWSEQSLVTIAHVYDPATNSWSAGRSPSLRQVQALALLADGRVLAVGQRELPSTLSSALLTETVPTPAELYDLGRDTWSDTGVLLLGSGTFPLLPLPDGRAVLVMDALRLHVYDPVSGQWSAGPAASIAQGGGASSVTLLADGRILAAYRRDTELFDSTSGTWRAGPRLTEERAFHTATLLPNGEVLVVGGSPLSLQVSLDQPTALATAERYAP